MTKSLEVHEHTYVSGPRANGGKYIGGKWQKSTFSHSHEGGNIRHQHVATGPATYTIDKDAWFRSTGLRGGGRKKFTAKPTGEQLPIRELAEWQQSFVVVIGPPTPRSMGEGPGVALPARLALSFRMPFTVEDDSK
jgi:hypothetical protein